MILMTIQKAADVEPVGPVQHLLFELINMINRESCGFSVVHHAGSGG
jgi:hypothetical protein